MTPPGREHGRWADRWTEVRATSRAGLTWLAVALACALVLSLLATLAGPAWAPPVWTTRVPITTSDTRIAPGAAPTTPVGAHRVATESVEVTLPDGLVVEATVRTPAGAVGDVPGVVVMHGTGTAGANAFYDVTTALASAGVASIVPAKRTDTYSLLHRDYHQLAADYGAAMDVLAATAGVDPARVGVYGESEGALIAPILAAERPSTAFVVLVSAPVVPLRWQGAAAADTYMRNTHVPATMRPVIPRILGGPFPGDVLGYLDTDTRPYLERLRQPVLTVYGTADDSMPLIQGAAQIEERLVAAGRTGQRPLVRDGGAASGDGGVRAWGHTVRYYAGGSHGIRVDSELIATWPRDLARWILGSPAAADAPPRVAGAEPAQAHAAAPVPEPGPWGRGWAVAAAPALAAVLLALGALAAPVARTREWQALRSMRRGGRSTAARDARAAVRERRDLRQAGWRAGLLAVGLVLAFAQWIARTVELAVDYTVDDSVVRGGLVLVYLLAVVAVGTVVSAVWETARRRRAPARVPVPGRAVHRVAVLGLVGGSAVLVAVAAYWGALPLWR